MLGDVGSSLASTDQGLEPHNAVERSEVPHSRVRPAHDGLDPHGRWDEDGIHLLVKQPVDVGAVRPLDDRRRGHHACSEFAAVLPRLDAADDALDCRRAPSELLGAKLLDSLECLSAEEDLGTSHLEAGHGAPAREVEGKEFLGVRRASDFAGQVGRANLPPLLCVVHLPALVGRGRSSRNRYEVHVTVDVVGVAALVA